MNKRIALWVVGVLVGLLVLVEAGTYIYIHFIEEDAPAPLALSNVVPTTSSSPLADTEVPGTWQATGESIVGYRVKEVINGQRKEAVGRTSSVSGSLTIEGTSVNTVALTVDMASMSSDSERRDGQFRGRIMNVRQFPTAMFTLTKPIVLSAIPADGDTITASATGDLTLHGVTRSVTFPLSAVRQGARFQVSGSIPVTFADYDVPNPSFGTVSTEDHGQLEFLVVFAKAG